MAFRYGDEECLVLLSQVEVTMAVEAANRIRTNLSALASDGSEVKVSFGVAVRNPKEDAESLVGRVDRTLYRAKLNGRDQVFVG
jgi:diguanylate cyclase (GGDEF)-like protein